MKTTATPLPRRRTAQPEPVLPRKRKLLGWTVLGSFVFGYLFVWAVFFPGWGRDAIVTVPDLRGKTVREAKGTADDHGLSVIVGNTLPNPYVPAGHVLTQQPLPGQEAARGAVVHLIMSGGPATRTVPALAGMELDEVKSLLARYGFAVQVTAVVDSSDEGKILGIAPAPGAAVPLPATVRITVSAGPPKEPAPNVVGLTLGQVQAVLDSAGLHLGRIAYDSTAAVALGTVVAQRPAAGDSVHQGGYVGVTVAGVAPPPPPVDSTGAAAAPAASDETAPQPAAPPAEAPAARPTPVPATPRPATPPTETRKPSAARPPAPPAGAPAPKAGTRPPAAPATKPPAAHPTTAPTGGRPTGAAPAATHPASGAPHPTTTARPATGTTTRPTTGTTARPTGTTAKPAASTQTNP